MQKELKVCFLVGTLGRGGAERQLVYMLRAAQKEGISTRLICLTQGESFEEEIRALGVPIEWIGASGSRPIRLARLTNSLRRDPADILQCSHFYTNLYGAVAGRILGIPGIGAIRNDLLSEIRANGVLGHWQVSLPQHLIANSELARRRAIDRGISPDRIDFLPNVVDQKPTRESAYCGSCPAIRISFVGRLVPQKRPELFLRVVARVSREVPERNLKITIAGDGPMRPGLEVLAAELGLGQDQLAFLGTQSDMDSVYRETDVLVMTSQHEGTPNALLEAMAWGIPTIATSVGGVPALLAEGRGLLVEPDNEDELVSTLRRLIVDSESRKRLGQSGREYVVRSHSLAALGRQLTKIYQRVLSR